MISLDHRRKEYLKMAIIGAILGDIVGSKWEFNRPWNLDWKGVELFAKDCFYTDDTVLTIATKYALQNKVSFTDAYYEFGIKYPNCSYGGGFSKWLKSSDRQPYNSCGNGSAMRVSPIVDFFDTLGSVSQYAESSAVCTHNHAEGIKGAVVTAVCGFMAKTGASKKKIEEYALRQYPEDSCLYPVSMTLDEMRRECGWDTTCQGSVPVAIRCFLDSEDYESFLRNVLSIRCDTDTLCAIGGGIAEEFYHGTVPNAHELLESYLPKELYDLVVS